MKLSIILLSLLVVLALFGESFGQPTQLRPPQNSQQTTPTINDINMFTDATVPIDDTTTFNPFDYIETSSTASK